ncbi:phage tail protein [Sorangium sp. So ce117]|uniref:phage tail protein n=1 Tax=Sorangium sp. So ce117 TaxID=3133277 RepID=UPI003F62EC3B
MATKREIPYSGFNFKVTVSGGSSGTITGKFSEVSGLDTDQDVIEYRSGEDPTLGMTKIPGLAKYPNVVLKRGILGVIDLWTWRKKVIDGIGDPDRKATVTVELLDEKRTTVMTWKITNAWPAKWTGPSLAGNKGETVIESLELAHEGITVE